MYWPFSQILFSFLVTFVVMTLAFSTGITYVVSKSYNSTNVTKATVFVGVGDSVHHKYEVTCVDVMNSSTSENCTMECITARIANPSNERYKEVE